VVGGGCYGTFYASQLAKAKARGKTEYRTVIVVDRNPDCQAKRELGEAPDRQFVVGDWAAFFDKWFLDARDDQIVPSPLMPHLMFEWVLRRARTRWPNRPVSVDPVPGGFPTPYDRPGSDQTRYVSWADWICPTHCIEPALCPAIGAPRTWEMADTVRDLAQRLRASGRPRYSSASTRSSASACSRPRRCATVIAWSPRRERAARPPRSSLARFRVATGL
jgi:hypothetical protein